MKPFHFKSCLSTVAIISLACSGIITTYVATHSFPQTQTTSISVTPTTKLHTEEPIQAKIVSSDEIIAAESSSSNTQNSSKEVTYGDIQSLPNPDKSESLPLLLADKDMES